ncbi:MAG: serine hydrolase [Acidobacteria bacterium]|nr:serine hydrolase [Acidobacteriota bacterium]
MALALAAGGADYFPVPDAAGGWRARKPSAAAQAKLDEAFEFAKTTTRHGGLVVVHQGWLVYERYFGLGHREAAPNTASCGKAFTSIAMGILMGERRDLFRDGLETKVFSMRYLPAAAPTEPAKLEIKLGHLLAMTSGIRGNNPSYVQGKQVTLDPPGPDGAAAMRDSAALNVGLWCRPGEGYSYATSGIHIVSMIIRHVTGREMEEYIAEKIARPLGWGRWGFGYKSSNLGHTPGGGGIALRATDMLRFGYLLLREGGWNGRQIVPRDYVRHCSRISQYNPHYPYSLQFDVNTDGQVAGAPRDAFWKSGSGGHALYVAPSLDLVIWKLGGRDEQYSEANTGLPAPPVRYDGSRDHFTASVTGDVAVSRTLEMAAAAFSAIR